MAGAALAICASTAVLNPYADQTPHCPFRALTGWWCPGCGVSRATWSLTHGDLAAAWARNPLVIVMLPYLLWEWLGWALDSAGGPHLWRLPRKPWVVVAGSVVLVLFGVARNLPWAPFRVLGP